MNDLEWLAKLAKGATIRTHRCFKIAPKIERETGRTPNAKCIMCNDAFYARPYMLRKGQGRFCSSTCFMEWRNRTDKA